MGFSTTELHASEGDGFVDFFIEVDREIEPEVFVQINRHPNEGITIVTGFLNVNVLESVSVCAQRKLYTSLLTYV